MYPTQLLGLKNVRPSQQTFTKLKIEFSQFQAFYNQLISEPIRPKIDDFFLLQQKVDIQENFKKYQEQSRVLQQHSFTKDEPSIELQQFQDVMPNDLQRKNKNIVFRVPSQETLKSENLTFESPINSKIKYFHVTQNLKNTLLKKDLNKKSFQTKKSDKQSFEKLKQFLYGDEAVFFLIKGNVQLHRKVQKSNPTQEKTIKDQDPSNNQTFKRQLSYLTDSSKRQSVQAMLMASNNIEIQKQRIQGPEDSSSQMVQNVMKQVQKEYKKHQQLKENSFFCLINYKNVKSLINSQPQLYKLVPKSQCFLAKILINEQFDIQFFKRQLKKLQILSSLFLTSNKSQIRKSEIFKTIFTAFEEEHMRRDMAISFEGKENQRLYLIGNEGEVEVMKKVYFKESQNVEGLKTIKICNIKGPSVVNGQSLISDSKLVTNLLKSNSFQKQLPEREVQQQDQNQDEKPIKKKNRADFKGNKKSDFKGRKDKETHTEQSDRKENSEDDDDIAQLQKQIIQKKKVSIGSVVSTLNKNDRYFFGKSQKAYCQFSSPQNNLSNFTIKSNTAFVTVYSIPLSKYFQIVPERMKNKLSKAVEQIYISLLRRASQKLAMFEKQVELSVDRKKNQLQKYSALASIQTYNTLSPKTKSTEVEVPISKISFINKKQFKGLKRNELVYKQGQIIEKKMQMIKTRTKLKTNDDNLVKNFKQKIENLIVQNLKDINSPHVELRNDSSQINKYYTENLMQILSNQGKSSQLNEKFHIAPDFKTIALNPKAKNSQFTSVGSTNQVQRQMFIDPDIFDPKKNKSVKINLIKKGHPCVVQDMNYLKPLQSNYSSQTKSLVSIKINQTNKIKEQFLKIESKCESCKCYDDLDSYKNLSEYHSAKSSRPLTEQHRNSSHDVKYHTMKIGVNWKTRYSSLGKIQSKTAYDERTLQKKMSEMAQDDEPFEKVYNRIKVLKHRSLEKFNFNQHLAKKRHDLKSKRQRKKSSPLLI